MSTCTCILCRPRVTKISFSEYRFIAQYLNNLEMRLCNKRGKYTINECVVGGVSES